LGSLVLFLAITQWTISPAPNISNPFSLVILWHPGGKILETETKLNFSDAEKEEALQTFKKKLAFELLKSIQGELPQNQQDWLVSGNGDINDPVFSEIQKTIQEMYGQEVLLEKSKPVFKKLVVDYVEFMSEGLDSESTAKLKEVIIKL